MERIRDLLPEALEKGEAVISSNAVVSSTAGQTSDSYSSQEYNDSESPDVVWQKAGLQLSQRLDSQIYAAWIKPLKLAAVEFRNTELSKSTDAILIAPNKFCCEHVSRHYGVVISEVLAGLLSADSVELTFKVSTLPAETKQTGTQKKAKISEISKIPGGCVA